MGFKIRSGGAWVDGQIRVRSGGAWVTPSEVRVRSGGAWSVNFMALDIEEITVGSTTVKGVTFRGFATSPSYGSISSGTFDPKGAAITGINHTSGAVTFSITGSHTNAGWTTMQIGSTNFSRSSASFSNSNPTIWTWTAANPFGADGTKSLVTFT